MLRFMRNRKKSSGNRKGASSEVATAAEEGGDAGAAGGEVVLTAIRIKDPDQPGATAYPGPDSGGAATGESLDNSGGETSGVEDVSKMAAIPEETSVDEEVERVVAAEPAYAYPDDEPQYACLESEGVDDEESVVTVIEKKQSEVEAEEEPPYATVKKPAQRLRSRGEMLDDRYTPDKELLPEGARAEQQLPRRADVEGTSEDEIDPATYPQAVPNEEDFYIYVSEDALRGSRPKTSPISVEPAAFSTFDSPERQDVLRDLEKLPLEGSDSNGAPPDQHGKYIRQMSAPTYPRAQDPYDRHERRYNSDLEEAEYNRRKQPHHSRKVKRGYERAMDYDNELDRESDREYPPRPYPEYDSDRSDYENFRSYDRRRPRHRDDSHMVIRHSPSGGFIERTHSMPTIRHDRHSPHGYPHQGPHRYRQPHERRSRSRRHNPDYDRYRDPNYRHRPFSDRHGHYPELHQNGYGSLHGRPRKGHPHQPNGYPIMHESYPEHHTANGIKYPLQTNTIPKANGDVIHPSRESPPCSATSTESGERRRDQRVSFRDLVDPKQGDETRFPETVKEDVTDDCEKALLAQEKDEDAVSLGSETSDMDEDELRPRRLVIRRSIAIWFAWFCMGFFTEVVGPNIPYLQGRVNGSHGDVAVSLGARGAGIVLGSTVGGLLCEVAPTFIDLWISSSLILGALCTSAVPWSINLTHLCLTLGLSGFSKGFLQVATVTLAFSLWAQQGAMYVIFLIHMAYAMGAAPCAQLAFLFDTGVLEQLLLGPNMTSNSLDYHRDSEADLVYSAEEQSAPVVKEPTEILSLLDYIPRPMYPFDMAAVLTFVCGAVFLGFFGSAVRSIPRQNPNKPRKPVAAIAGAQVQPAPLDGKCFLSGACGVRGVLSFLIYFLLPMGILSIIGSYHHLYLISMAGSHLLKSHALLLQTVFWGTVAVGRLITPVTTHCVSPNGLTISCLTMSILSTALLAVYGAKYPVFLWIFTILLGTFTGPILPAGLTLCSICVSPSALGVAAVFLVQAVGDGVFSWAAGFMLQHLRSDYLIYIALASTGASFILYLPVIPVLARSKWQLQPKNKKKVPRGKAIG